MKRTAKFSGAMVEFSHSYRPLRFFSASWCQSNQAYVAILNALCCVILGCFVSVNSAQAEGEWYANHCNVGGYTSVKGGLGASMICNNINTGVNFKYGDITSSEATVIADGIHPFYTGAAAAVLQCPYPDTPTTSTAVLFRCVKNEGNRAPDASPTCQQGNPVAVKDGNKEQTFVDWSSGGAFPLQFTRSYSAFYELTYAPMSTMFGMAWRSNFDASARYVFSTGATLTGSPSSGDRIHIALPDGYEYHFVYDSNTWRPMLASSTGVWNNFRNDAKYTGLHPISETR
jgi:hypothetical protein